MGSSFLRGIGFLALAAAFGPMVFFGLLILMALGVAGITMGPVIWAFIGWMVVSRMHRKAKKEQIDEDNRLAERRQREDGPLPYPAEAYTPPVHFDLLLSAKGDIGRMRGAASAIHDASIAKQVRSLAEAADRVMAQIISEPAKLGLARRFFSSYLPRAADLSEGWHRIAAGERADDSRRAKLLDVLYRLETAMRESEKDLSSPDRARMDADLKILTDDLKGMAPTKPQVEAQPMPPLKPDFMGSSEPILSRIDEIVKEAKRRK